MKTLFCLAEDRRGAEIGLKFAVLSLEEHCRGSRVVIFRPESAPGFAIWLRKFPNVQLIARRLPGANNWNCKPHALLELLPGIDDNTQLVWLDSDLVLTNDIRPLLAQGAYNEIVVSQEPVNQPFRGSEIRTRGWSLPVGRVLEDTTNSCVVRVTSRHGHLLKRWHELLEDPRYVAASNLPTEKKAPHLWGDQDVLCALLGSTEFASLPLRLLAHGRDILHTGGAVGFTLMERFHGLVRPLPPVLHAIAGKPWVLLRKENHWPGGFAWFRRLLQEISPYVAYVRKYRSHVDESMDWINHRTWVGSILKIMGMGHWALRGLPVTLMATVVEWFRKSPR